MTDLEKAVAAINHTSDPATWGFGKPDERDYIRAILEAVGRPQDGARDEQIANALFEDMGETFTATAEGYARYVLDRTA